MSPPSLESNGCVDSANGASDITMKEFLDNNQYTEKGVLKYEFVFGSGFISTGGIASTRKIFTDNPIPKGSKVLDVGSGIGGGAQFLSEQFNADVLGIDLSSNCVALANSRFKDIPNVHFEAADVLEREFTPNHFDLVYSRDAIIHIEEKHKLFSILHASTKPGGQLIITDYCCGPMDAWDEEFRDYVRQRGYNLLEVHQYADVLRKSGWTVVKAEDTTKWFEEILKKEMADAEANKAEFLTKFSEPEYRQLLSGWESKLERVAKGHQRWGLFVAQKSQA